jgi:hypothetical protein
LCAPLHSFVTSLLLGTDIFLRIPFRPPSAYYRDNIVHFHISIISLIFELTQQARSTNNSRNAQYKLCKTSAAMWHKTICRNSQLTPNYVNIVNNCVKTPPYDIFNTL